MCRFQPVFVRSTRSAEVIAFFFPSFIYGMMQSGARRAHGLCGHGDAARAANKSPPITTATPVFACNEDAMYAVEAVGNNGGVAKIHVLQMVEICEEGAKAACVPVSLRVGQTGWFAGAISSAIPRP